ncbi:Protein arginine N-methyltransferase 3 [Datura stramonium]|uniref:Protein arginine N-methyltransferase 3 n=1 Tax=Datura stramonium TaxID=4076 RepID=A0ABS8VMN0_DATST|nr:Protein arginine N-methyltransferase 3 [Datura stramonium]
MDVGCGTGILSLFAAQAGASKVIAVEASEKMAAVATQGNGVMEVVQGMVEELKNTHRVQPHSVDVLPEVPFLPGHGNHVCCWVWKGVVQAFHFGKIYGFNMSCIGEEIFKDASRIPIVDVIDSCDIITNSTVLQNF